MPDPGNTWQIWASKRLWAEAVLAYMQHRYCPTQIWEVVNSLVRYARSDSRAERRALTKEIVRGVGQLIKQGVLLRSRRKFIILKSNLSFALATNALQGHFKHALAAVTELRQRLEIPEDFELFLTKAGSVSDVADAPVTSLTEADAVQTEADAVQTEAEYAPIACRSSKNFTATCVCGQVLDTAASFKTHLMKKHGIDLDADTIPVAIDDTLSKELPVVLEPHAPLSDEAMDKLGCMEAVDGAYQCPCGASFPYRSYFIRHLQRSHGLTARKKAALAAKRNVRPPVSPAEELPEPKALREFEVSAVLKEASIVLTPEQSMLFIAGEVISLESDVYKAQCIAAFSGSSLVLKRYSPAISKKYRGNLLPLLTRRSKSALNRMVLKEVEYGIFNVVFTQVQKDEIKRAALNQLELMALPVGPAVVKQETLKRYDAI